MVLAGRWASFIARRALSLVFLLSGLVVATFLMVRMIPGDPAVLVLGDNATAADITRARHALGLDVPPAAQLLTYCANLLHGDLGTSFASGYSVTAVIAERMGSSIQLAAAALTVVLLVSIPGGLLAAAYTEHGRRKNAEAVLTGATSVLGSLPEFLTATFVAFVFAVWLRLLPVAGEASWKSLVLPVLAIALRPIAVLVRIVRLEALNVLASDYVRTARSKRLPPRLIYLRHVLPNVVSAALTIGGLLFAGLIGGAVVIENVFARNGLGTALIAAVLARDYPVVQGITLVLGTVVVLANAIVDLLLATVNPRYMEPEA
jgi:peptide/nickel transport system permease protein